MRGTSLVEGTVGRNRRMEKGAFSCLILATKTAGQGTSSTSVALLDPGRLREEPAVHPERLARDEGCLRAGEKCDSTRDVGGIADAAQGRDGTPGAGVVRQFELRAFDFDGARRH